MTTEESENDYKSICPRDTGAGVLRDYESQLYCNGDDVATWHNRKNQFISKYNQARECAIKRIKRMKSHCTSTPQNILARRNHVFPIQVAYTYAKDCLRKTANSSKQITEFTNEINEHITEAAATQPDITSAQVFGNKGIEHSIIAAPNYGDMIKIKQVLQKPYYTPDVWSIIFNGRKAHSYGSNLSELNENFANFIMQKRSNYENLKSSHLGKRTRRQKQRKLKSFRKTRRYGIL